MAFADSGFAIWQVSAGPANRTYGDLFLEFGVALIGPGDAGSWSCSRLDEDFGGGFIRRFASELRNGDVLLLRSGLKTIRAVGRVAGDYVYLPQFDDVNGWDLQHARRVRWAELPEPYEFATPVFGASPSRLSRVQVTEVVAYANRFIQSPPTAWQTGNLPNLPKEEAGLASVPDELREVVSQIHDLSRLYVDVKAFGDRPTEDELVAHYVVPFLRALGWPVERIAVKWRNIDVYVFTKLPRTPGHCQFLIEAKRLGAGVEGALRQATCYVSDLGVSCDVVVTDGVRYRMYNSSDNFAPVAYAHLARLKQSSLELFNRMRKP